MKNSYTRIKYQVEFVKAFNEIRTLQSWTID